MSGTTGDGSVTQEDALRILAFTADSFGKTPEIVDALRASNVLTPRNRTLINALDAQYARGSRSSALGGTASLALENFVKYNDLITNVIICDTDGLAVAAHPLPRRLFQGVVHDIDPTKPTAHILELTYDSGTGTIAAEFSNNVMIADQPAFLIVSLNMTTISAIVRWLPEHGRLGRPLNGLPIPLIRRLSAWKPIMRLIAPMLGNWTGGTRVARAFTASVRSVDGQAMLSAEKLALQYAHEYRIQEQRVKWEKLSGTTGPLRMTIAAFYLDPGCRSYTGFCLVEEVSVGLTPAELASSITSQHTLSRLLRSTGDYSIREESVVLPDNVCPDCAFGAVWHIQTPVSVEPGGRGFVLRDASPESFDALSRRVGVSQFGTRRTIVERSRSALSASGNATFTYIDAHGVEHDLGVIVGPGVEPPLTTLLSDDSAAVGASGRARARSADGASIIASSLPTAESPYVLPNARYDLSPIILRPLHCPNTFTTYVQFIEDMRTPALFTRPGFEVPIRPKEADGARRFIQIECVASACTYSTYTPPSAVWPSLGLQALVGNSRTTTIRDVSNKSLPASAATLTLATLRSSADDPAVPVISPSTAVGPVEEPMLILTSDGGAAVGYGGVGAAAHAGRTDGVVGAANRVRAAVTSPSGPLPSSPADELLLPTPPIPSIPTAVPIPLFNPNTTLVEFQVSYAQHTVTPTPNETVGGANSLTTDFYEVDDALVIPAPEIVLPPSITGFVYVIMTHLVSYITPYDLILQEVISANAKAGRTDAEVLQYLSTFRRSERLLNSFVSGFLRSVVQTTGKHMFDGVATYDRDGIMIGCHPVDTRLSTYLEKADRHKADGGLVFLKASRLRSPTVNGSFMNQVRLQLLLRVDIIARNATYISDGRAPSIYTTYFATDYVMYLSETHRYVTPRGNVLAFTPGVRLPRLAVGSYDVIHEYMMGYEHKMFGSFTYRIGIVDCGTGTVRNDGTCKADQLSLMLTLILVGVTIFVAVLVLVGVLIRLYHKYRVQRAKYDELPRPRVINLDGRSDSEDDEQQKDRSDALIERPPSVPSYGVHVPGCFAMFTDIEASTQLWQQYSPLMEEAVAEHHRVIRARCAKLGGIEVNSQGDSFFFVFHTAAECVETCVMIQLDLLTARWRSRLLRIPLLMTSNEADADVSTEGGKRESVRLHSRSTRTRKVPTAGSGSGPVRANPGASSACESLSTVHNSVANQGPGGLIQGPRSAVSDVPPSRMMSTRLSFSHVHATQLAPRSGMASPGIDAGVSPLAGADESFSMHPAAVLSADDRVVLTPTKGLPVTSPLYDIGANANVAPGGTIGPFGQASKPGTPTGVHRGDFTQVSDPAQRASNVTSSNGTSSSDPNRGSVPPLVPANGGQPTAAVQLPLDNGVATSGTRDVTPTVRARDGAGHGAAHLGHTAAALSPPGRSAPYHAAGGSRPLYIDPAFNHTGYSGLDSAISGPTTVAAMANPNSPLDYHAIGPNRGVRAPGPRLPQQADSAGAPVMYGTMTDEKSSSVAVRGADARQRVHVLSADYAPHRSSAPFPDQTLSDYTSPALSWRGLRVRIGASSLTNARLHLFGLQSFKEYLASCGSAQKGSALAFDYVGPDVNRAARVASAARGGEVIIPECMMDELPQEMIDRLSVVRMGGVFLKGIGNSGELVSLLPKGLVRTFTTQASATHCEKCFGLLSCAACDAQDARLGEWMGAVP